MNSCRCLRELDSKGYVEDRCYLPCDVFIKEIAVRDTLPDNASDDNNTSTKINLKLEALIKIEERYPDTYKDRSDYKIIKHNIDYE